MVLGSCSFLESDSIEQWRVYKVAFIDDPPSCVQLHCSYAAEGHEGRPELQVRRRRR